MGGRESDSGADVGAADEDDRAGEDDGERPSRLCMTNLASADCFDCFRPASKMDEMVSMAVMFCVSRRDDRRELVEVDGGGNSIGETGGDDGKQGLM